MNGPVPIRQLGSQRSSVVHLDIGLIATAKFAEFYLKIPLTVALIAVGSMLAGH